MSLSIDNPQILSIHGFIFSLLATIYRTYNTKHITTVFSLSAPSREQSIVMSVSVCLSVRLHTCLSVLGPIFGTPRPIFIEFSVLSTVA